MFQSFGMEAPLMVLQEHLRFEAIVEIAVRNKALQSPRLNCICLHLQEGNRCRASTAVTPHAMGDQVSHIDFCGGIRKLSFLCQRRRDIAHYTVCLRSYLSLVGEDQV